MKAYVTILFAATLVSCGNNGDQITSTAEQHGEQQVNEVLHHADWSKNMSIYEVNVRQYSPEGTLDAVRKDLPRLKELGVGILWLMPIHPIGKENRKGSLGSYYSARDYKAVNPEFGTLEDFKLFVNDAHSYGMKVIIDWVANHSGFDNVWTKEHKDYYLLDSLGNLQPPTGTDWWDVAQLNYENEDTRVAMIDAMKFWLVEGQIDGFRCDVADFVPVDFWNRARKELSAVNPDIFMLAEAENPLHHIEAFDMSYSWELMHVMNEIAKGNKTLNDLDTYLAKEDTNFVANAYRMTFTTNHDENSWNGTVFERYGDGHLAFATLAFNLGTPLIYSGQEAGMERRLRFFDKDTIPWDGYKYADFYSKMMNVHRDQEALWNGPYGGKIERIKTANDDVVYAFIRKQGASEVLTIVNLSATPTTVVFEESISGDFTSIFNQFKLTVFANGELPLDAWGYQVFVKNPA
ncbi:MAG: alpha-amylase family glycosyl hydrolase [Flavobacteriales bacterium]|nr:alpha-amylase family glycosyl hydrolase [Flavobacteriales bacterium]